MTHLRPYQADAIARARLAFHQGAQSVLIVQPTGCGKTRTAVEACFGHSKLGGLPMFVAPRRELVRQATNELEARGLRPDWDVHVRSIQELTQEGAKIPNASMVVLDEARHYVADKWSELRKALPDAIYLGLDATPERSDGLGLSPMFDTLIEAITVKAAIAGGHLVPCEVLRPDHALGPRQLAQDPVETYLERARGASTVLFASSVELAVEYAKRLCNAGVRAEAVWGDMPTRLRDLALHYYAQGEVKVLCNVQLLTEGWDAPRTECVILAGAIGTAGGYLQRVGRGLRPSPGKTKCLILDLRGASHVHGEPDDERSWHLEGRAARRKSEDANIRFCPVCGSPVLEGVCEQCGHAGEMRRRKPRVLGLPMDRFARQHAMPDEEAAKALRGYLHVARSRGYRRGWAYRCFEHKYGRRVTPTLLRMANGSGG